MRYHEINEDVGASLTSTPHEEKEHNVGSRTLPKIVKSQKFDVSKDGKKLGNVKTYVTYSEKKASGKSKPSPAKVRWQSSSTNPQHRTVFNHISKQDAVDQLLRHHAADAQIHEDTLSETPIGSYQTIGNFDKAHSFLSPVDRKLVTNPKAIQKIKTKFARTTETFNLYFVNEVGYAKFHEKGEVSREWLEENMSKVLPQLDLSDDAINLIFTNNIGAEKVPMTAWVLAHRTSHSLIRKNGMTDRYLSSKYDDFCTDVKAIMASAYNVGSLARKYDFEMQAEQDKLLKSFFTAIGTMKSARDNNLRNYFEFVHEMFAQYLLTGKIKFNDLPRSFKFGKAAWGNYQSKYMKHDLTPEQIEDLNYDLHALAEQMQYSFDEILGSSIGKVFVM